MVAEESSPPPGWCLDENGAWRRETVHSMTRRCLDWNYGQRAIYEITVELADRRSKALGRLLIGDGAGGWVAPVEARGLGLRPEDVAAKVELTALGKAVADCWESIPKFYPKIKIIGKRVMPDHFHGLLFVTEALGCHLGQVIKGFKIGCNKAARVLDPAILSPGTERGAAGAGLFAEGFTDVILFHDGQLENQINYLADNPWRLAVKTLFPELFTVVDFATDDFEERRAELFAAAKHGAVLLSPCVSDGERQIAREALKTGWSLVTMANKGFARLQKPSGRYFDACAAGKLLMLAPAAWPYRPGEKPMTRFDATAMNRLCQWLAGEDAAEINYHGLTPANVDALAREAARVS